MDFLLPTLGENIQNADVIRVLVSPGQEIQKDEPILELETAKAVFELPAPQNAKVQEILVKAGDKVKVGQLVMRLEAGAAAPVEGEKKTVKTEVKKEVAKPVNSDPKTPQTKARSTEAKVETRPTFQGSSFASPLVRRLAREKGIELSQIHPSGPHGRILPEDLEQNTSAPIQNSESKTLAPSIPLPDFSKWGSVERKPMSQLRLAAAKNLSQAWSQIPHVTQMEEADVTETEKWRKAQEPKPTMSAILIQVMAELLEEFPMFNCSVDLEKEEIIYKKYKHIGVAVDTERGLVVPVIQNVDQKDLSQIAEDLKSLSEKARSKKLKMEEMQGASMTLSNLGGIGGTFFTPIVNWPEVAILGICQARTQARWKDQGVAPRLIMPLSLSYDHRVIDGADAIRFLRALVERIEKFK